MINDRYNKQTPYRPATNVGYGLYTVPSFTETSSYGQMMLSAKRKADEERKIREKEKLDRINADRKRREWNRKIAERRYEREQKELKERIARQKEDEARAKAAAEKQEDKDFFKNLPKAELNFIKNHPTLSSYAPHIRLVTGAQRAIWLLNNMLGSLAESSISVNGETIMGKKSEQELRINSANAHAQIEKLKADYLDVTNRLKEYDYWYLRNKEYMSSHKDDESVKQTEELKKYLEEAKQSLEQLLLDPNLVGLDDAYKEFIVKDKRSVFSTISYALDPFLKGWNNQEHLMQAYKKRIQDDYNAYLAGDVEKSKSGTVGEVEQNNVSTMINDAKGKIKVLTQDYLDNRDHLRRSKEYWNVAKGYTMAKDAHLNDTLIDPNYWLYEMAPMIGSSMSSPSLAAASAMKTAASVVGVAAAPATSGASLALLPASEIGATPLEIQGGFDENYAEIATRRAENILALLKDMWDYPGRGGKEEAAEENIKILQELKNRSAKYWKLAGQSDSYIKKYLDGDEGEKNAIRDYIMGITSGAVKDKNGKPMFNEYTNPVFQSALLNSTQGLMAQFNTDNIRTMYDIAFLKAALGVMPIKWLRGMSVSPEGSIAGNIFRTASGNVKRVSSDVAESLRYNATKAVGKKGTLLANEIKHETYLAEKQAAKQTASRTGKREISTETPEFSAGRTRGASAANASTPKPQGGSFIENAKHDFKTGASIGEATGRGVTGHLAGGAIGVATGAAGRGAIRLVKDKLPANVRSALGGFVENVEKKYYTVLDKLTPSNPLGRILAKYGIKTIGSLSAVALNESYEEAVQSLNSREDFASKYGYMGGDFASLIMNDAKQGGRVFNAYMAMLGLGESPLLNDIDFWSEAKGGAALGFFGLGNVSSVVSVASSANNIYKEYKAADLLMTPGIMNREYDKRARSTDASFAKMAMSGNGLYLITALNDMLAMDSHRKNPAYSQELYEERKKDITDLINLSTDKSIKSILEAKGFKYKSDEYATAIADIHALNQARSENQKQYNEVLQKISNILAQDPFQATVNDKMNLVVSLADKIEERRNLIFTEGLEKIGDDQAREVLGLKKGDPLDKESKEYKRMLKSYKFRFPVHHKMKLLWESARELAEKEVTGAYNRGIRNRSAIVSELQALFLLLTRHGEIDDTLSTINGAMDEIRKKFGIRIPRREDASLAKSKISERIDQLKELLYDSVKGTSLEFDKNLPNDKLYSLLESIGDTAVETSALNDLYAQKMMLEIDRAVTDRLYESFTKNIVFRDGKAVYSPMLYKQEQELNKQFYSALSKGDLNAMREISERKDQLKLADVSDDATDKDEYRQRISAIMQALADNIKIDHAINDIIGGDAVSKLYEQFEQDEKDLLRLEEEKKRKNSLLSAARPAFDPTPSPIPSSETHTPQPESGNNNRRKERTEELKRELVKRARKIKAASLENKMKELFRNHFRKYAGRLNSNIPIDQFADLIATNLRAAILGGKWLAVKGTDVIDRAFLVLQSRLSENKKRLFAENPEILQKAKELILPDLEDLLLQAIENAELQGETKPKDEVDPKTETEDKEGQTNHGQTVISKIERGQQTVQPDGSSYYFVISDTGVYYNTSSISKNLSRNEFFKLSRDIYASLVENADNELFSNVYKKLKENSLLNPITEIQGAEDYLQAFVNYLHSKGLQNEEEAKIFGYYIANIRALCGLDSLLNAAISREAFVDYFTLSTDVRLSLNNELLNGRTHKISDESDVLLQRIKKSIVDSGYTFVNTRNNIYGIIDGERVCIQLDLLAINSDGDAILIDVVTSKKQLNDSHKQSAKDTLDIAERILRSYGILKVEKRLLLATTKIENNLLVINTNGDLVDINDYNEERKQKDIAEKYEIYDRAYYTYQCLIDRYGFLYEQLNKNDEPLTPVEKKQISSYINIEEINADISTITKQINLLLKKVDQWLGEYDAEFYSITSVESYNEDLTLDELLHNYISDLDPAVTNFVKEPSQDNSTKLYAAILQAQAALVRSVKFGLPEAHFDDELNKIIYATLQYNSAVANKQINDQFFIPVAIITKFLPHQLADIKTLHEITTSVMPKQDGVDDYSATLTAYMAQVVGFCAMFGLTEDGLNKDVVRDVLLNSENEDIIRFYGEVANNIVPQLLHNAEDFIATNEKELNEAGEDIERNIDMLRYIKKQFNQIIGPDGYLYNIYAVEKKSVNSYIALLNSMVPSHKTVGDKYTKEVYFNIAEMRDSADFCKMSTALDFMDTVEFVSGNTTVDDEYLKDKRGYTICQLSIGKDGHVVLHLVYTGTAANGGKLEATLHLNLSPNEFGETARLAMELYDKHAKDLERYIQKLLKQILNLPKELNAKLDFKVNVRPGSANFNGQDRNVKDVLFASDGNRHDLYTIQIGVSDGIGFFKTKKGGDKITQSIMDATMNTTLQLLDSDVRSPMKINSGQLAYMFKTDNHGGYLVVGMLPDHFGVENANAVIDLMTAARNSSDTSVAGRININGVSFTIEELVYMALQHCDPKKNVFAKSSLHINLYAGTVSIPTISGKGAPNMKAWLTYSIYDEGSKAQLISVLSNMFVNVDKSIINTSLGELKDNSNSVYYKVYQAVKNSTQTKTINGKEYKYVTLPNGFTFSEDDFDHDNNNGTHGRTVLGYLLNEGKVMSRFNGFRYREITLSGVRIEVDDDPLISPTEEKPLYTEAQEESADTAFDDFLGFTGKDGDVHNRTKSEQTEFERIAKQYFADVFGDRDLVEMSKEDRVFLQISSTNASILGYCTSKIAVLSKYAPQSAIYHEAFHRLMELILPKEIREDFYNQYRARYGEDLTERLVAEGLTDLFVDYKEDSKVRNSLRWYSKLIRWFKVIKAQINLYKKIGFTNSIKLGILYHDFEHGKYKNSIPYLENIDRFKSEFGKEGLHYEYNGSKFEHFASDHDLHDAARALGFLILSTQLKDDPYIDTKINISETTPGSIEKAWEKIKAKLPQESEKVAAILELFESETVTRKRKVWKIDKKTKRRYKTSEEYSVKIYPKFAAIQQEVSNYIANIIGDFSIKEEAEDTTNNDGFEDSLLGKGIDKHIKESYRFSRLSKASKMVNVFFGTVPVMIYKKQKDGSALLVPDLSISKYGFPTYHPKQYIFNLMCKRLSNCESLYDLEIELNRLVEEGSGPEFEYIRGKFKRLMDEAYGKNHIQNGLVVITHPHKQIKYTAESLALSILNTIRSQVIDYTYFTGEKTDNGLDILSKSAGKDRDVYRYASMWMNNLLSGTSGLLSRVHMDNVYRYAEQYNGTRYDPIQGYISALKAVGGFTNTRTNEITMRIGTNAGVWEKTYRRDNAADMKELVLAIQKILFKFGIDIKQAALLERARDIVHEQIKNGAVVDTAFALGLIFSESTPFAEKFYETVSKFSQISISGKPEIVSQELLNFKNAYSKLGFVNELANIQAQYMQFRTTQMRYGFGNKKLYIISQNSGISHIVRHLNSKNKNDDTIKMLRNFGYNVSVRNGKQIGSIILKNFGNNNIQCHTIIGVKAKIKRGDAGNAYSEMAPIDDYLTKMNALSDGIFIFPTLSDKSTYYTMSGISLPGLEYGLQKDADGNVVQKCVGMTLEVMPMVYDTEDGPYVVTRPTEAQLNQMLEYAYTERDQIAKCIDDMESGRIQKKDFVANYHTKKQGLRFWSLTEIYTTEHAANGKVKIKRICLNNKNVDPKELLRLADENFFNLSVEEQKQILSLTLNKQLELELDKSIKNGIVFRNNTGFLVPKLLPYEKIKSIIVAYNNLFGERFNNLPAEQKVDYAIRQFYMDVECKSIMCAEETYRCFSGHPGQFKVTWNEKTGEILDSAIDLLKRIGGLVSTGDDNAMNLPTTDGKNLNKYRAAELLSYKVKSSADAMAVLHHSMKQCLLVDTLRLLINERMRKYDSNISEIEYDINDTRMELRQSSNPEQIDKLNGQIDSLTRKKDDLEAARRQVFPDFGISTTEDLYTKDLHDLAAVIEKYGWTDIINNAEGIADRAYFSYVEDRAIDVADGAAYITSEMCERMLRARGALKGKIKHAFDILNSDDTAYSWQDKYDAYKDIYDAVNLVSTKYTAYGFRPHRSLNQDGSYVDSSDMAVAYYYKFALFPIFKCLATGDMDGIYSKMLSQKVDMLLMDSAVKVGSQGAVEFKDGLILGDLNVYEQDMGFIRRQLETDPEEGDKQSLGTQFVKIALSALRVDRIYTDPNTGENITGRDLVDNLMDTIKELSEIGALEIRDQFCKNGKVSEKKLAKYLYGKFAGKNANTNQLKMLRTDTDGNLIAPLDASSDASWIEQIIHKYIYKKVLDIVTPGTSYVQRSVFAMEGSASANKLYNGARLQIINNKNSMDCVLSMDFFDQIIPDEFIVGGETVLKDNASFSQRKQFLLEQNIIGANANPLCIGYRIPTQAIASINALRCVDIIPAVKTTVILPEEFTKLTGSDFDIDHLYLALHNYKYIDGKLVTSSDDGFSRSEILLNHLLDLYMTLLTDHDRANHMLMRSIDDDTRLPRRIADQISDENQIKQTAYNFGTLHELTDRKNDYITGKEGIGPFALNLTSSVLTQLYPVLFDTTDPFISATGLKGIDCMLDVNGDYVSSWMSGYINGHVDIVKDPWVSKLNINSATYNMINFFIRVGLGEFGTFLMVLPIIRDLAQIKQNNKSSLVLLDKDARKTVINSYFTDEKQLRIATNKSPKTAANRGGKVFRLLYGDKGAFLQKMKDVATGKIKKGDLDYATTQQDAYMLWVLLEDLAKAVGNLVLYTKVDTRKCGNTFAATRRYYRRYVSLYNNDDLVFDEDSLVAFLTSTWIDSKTEAAFNLPREILRGQCFAATSEIDDMVDGYCTFFDDDSDHFCTEVQNLLITKIKLEYFVRYAQEILKLDPGLPNDTVKMEDTIGGLFFGSLSIANQLMTIINFASTRNEFKYLLNNRLIASLYAQPTSDSQVNRDVDLSLPGADAKAKAPQFISILSDIDDDSMAESEVVSAWNDLLLDPHESVRKFAKRLIVYAALTSGNNKGWNKIYKFVPAEWITGRYDPNYEPYSKFIKDRLVDMQTESGDKLYIDVVQNTPSIFSHNIIPGDVLYMSDNILVYSITENVPPILESKHGEIYMLVGSDNNENLNKKPSVALYTRLDRRGYSDNLRNNIYEYGYRLPYYGNTQHDSTKLLEDKRWVHNFNFSRSRDWTYIENFEKEYIKGQKANVDYSKYPAVAIATRPYEKDQPELFREFVYVFTENALVFLYTRLTPQFETDVNKMYDELGVKIEPSIDVNGQYNLAKIRTNKFGAINRNAIGLVVKKLQQDANGNFIYESGFFLDTDEDFEMFKHLNDIAVDEIFKYPSLHVVFPQNLALGKAALPLRFAEHLLKLIESNFGIVSTIQEHPKYKGLYGLRIDSVLPNSKYELEKQNTTRSLENYVADLVSDEYDPETITSNIMEAINNGIDFKQALNSVLSIFTEKELEQINTRKKPIRVKSASRHTDPVFFKDRIIEFLKENSKLSLSDDNRILAMEIWTKHDGEPLVEILENCRKYKVAPMVSFSITGVGGTALEPGVMKYNDLLDRIQKLIFEGYLDPRTTTIRIDPLLPGYTNMDDIVNIVTRAKAMGIRKFVTSVVLSYGYTTGKKDYLDRNGYFHKGDRFVVSGITNALKKENIDYDWETNYGVVTEEEVKEYEDFCNQKRSESDGSKLTDAELEKMAIEANIHPVRRWEIGKIAHIAKPAVVKKMVQALVKLNEDPTIEIESCSYPIPGLNSSACLDPDIIAAVIGKSVCDEGGQYAKEKTRVGCCCYNNHSDLFSYNDKCPSVCAYCYGAQGETAKESVHTYYDNNGKLIDSEYTRVTSRNGVRSIKAPHVKDIVVVSGGAYGADTMWDLVGTGRYSAPQTSDGDVTVSVENKLNIDNVHHIISYRNDGVLPSVTSKFLRDNNTVPFVANKNYMDFARELMKKIYGHEFKDEYIDNLIVRDYLLVLYTDAVYAVSNINNDMSGVSGGTNHAVTVAKSQKKPIFVLDIQSSKWFEYNYDSNKFEEHDGPVTLHQRSALVGSRTLLSYNTKNGPSKYVGKEKELELAQKMAEVFENTEKLANLYDRLNISDDLAKQAEEIKKQCKG